MILILVLVGYLVLGWRNREPTLLGGGDELVYTSLSQSLEQGSYREIFRPHEPFHIRLPPLYPAWLVPVRHLVGEDLDGIRATNLILVAISFALFFGIARIVLGVPLALALVVLLASNDTIMMVGGSVLSEPFYLFLSTLALALAYHAPEGDRGSSKWVIVLALLAYLARSVGISLIVAVGVWTWRQKRRRDLAHWAVASALVIGGWTAYTMLVPRGAGGWSYTQAFTDGKSRAATFALGEYLLRAARNAFGYATQDLPWALSVPTVGGTVIDNVVWTILLGSCLAIGWWALWGQRRLLGAYLAVYAGLLLAWPWRFNRLLAPILPLVYLTFLLGAKRLTERLPVRTGRMALAGLVALLTMGATIAAARRYSQLKSCDRAQPYTSPGCYDASSLSFVAAATYLRDRIAPLHPGATVLAAKSPSLYYLSGLRTEPAPQVDLGPHGGAAARLRQLGLQYVLLTDMDPFERGPLTRRLLAACAELRVEARFPPHAYLFAVAPTALPIGESACGDLAAFQEAIHSAPDPGRE